MKKFVLALLTMALTFSNTLTTFADTSEENMIAVQFEEMPVTVYIEREQHMINSRCIPEFNLVVAGNEAGALKEGTKLSFNISPMKFDGLFIKDIDGDLEIADRIQDDRIIDMTHQATSLRTVL